MKETEDPLPVARSEHLAKPATGLTAHILPTSATMIGACVAVLSIGHLGPAGRLQVIVDKLLSIDALMFLASAVLSFISLRSVKSTARLEARAELIFIGGLSLLALGTVVLSLNIR